MSDEQEKEVEKVEPKDNGNTVPQWLRTSIVASIAIAFLVHIGYDAITDDYAEFNTSFLLLGFVGIALGYDVIGRKQ